MRPRTRDRQPHPDRRERASHVRDHHPPRACATRFGGLAAGRTCAARWIVLTKTEREAIIAASVILLDAFKREDRWHR